MFSILTIEDVWAGLIKSNCNADISGMDVIPCNCICMAAMFPAGLLMFSKEKMVNGFGSGSS